MAQKLEEQQLGGLQGLAAAANAAVDAPADPEREVLAPQLEALVAEAGRYATATGAIDEDARALTLTLSDASELASQIGATTAVQGSGGCASLTDAAIEVEKENGASAAGGVLPQLRKHLETGKATKQMRLC